MEPEGDLKDAKSLNREVIQWFNDITFICFTIVETGQQTRIY